MNRRNANYAQKMRLFLQVPKVEMQYDRYANKITNEQTRHQHNALYKYQFTLTEGYSYKTTLKHIDRFNRMSVP